MKTEIKKSKSGIICSLEQALEKVKNYKPKSRLKRENRKWLEAGHADSYDNERYRVEFLVEEGSPAKGFITVIHSDYGFGIVLRYDNLGRKLIHCRFQDHDSE